MPQPKSPRGLIGTAANGDATGIRTDNDGILIVDPQPSSPVAVTLDEPVAVTIEDQPILVTLGDPISNGDVFYIFDRATIGILRTVVLRVGSVPLRMRFNVQAGVACPVDITEGTTAGSSGTTLTVRNFNRASVASIGLTAVVNATSVTGGTIIFSSQASIGVALGPGLGNLLDALVDPLDYWVLNANTNYLISYTPVASLAVTFMATFRAHT